MRLLDAADLSPEPPGSQSFDGYLQVFHWTELIQSSPIVVERAVYEVVGGAYRKNNITTIEFRFNPILVDDEQAPLDPPTEAQVEPVVQ